MKYIDSEKLISELTIMQFSLNAAYRKPQSDNIVRAISLEYDDILSLITSLQQEHPETKEQISHLEHWLAFFGCPEENIEKCATQIAQNYGAIRYLEGVQRGAEAVNELAQQEQPEVDLEGEVEFYCINKKVKMTIQELINYYIDTECAETADECGF